MEIFLIAAVARDGAIGQDGALPWPRLRHDRRWFHRLTTRPVPEAYAQGVCAPPPCPHGHAQAWRNSVIMGRCTWQSLPGLELPGRHAMILSRCSAWRAAVPEGVETLEEALDRASEYGSPHAFVIGGAEPYAAALPLSGLRTAFLTEIDASFPDADTWFPGAHDYGPLGCWQEHGALALSPHRGEWHRAEAGPWVEEHGLRYRLTIWRKH